MSSSEDGNYSKYSRVYSNLVLEYRICSERETIYKKITEDIRWSIETLSEIYRYKLGITLTSADMLHLHIL